jgi:3-hydroxyacyl-CoA dehydrogenase
MHEAVADADFVQENAPERPELRIKLFAGLDAAAPADAIIASSSYGITMSVMQAGAGTRGGRSSAPRSTRRTSSGSSRSSAARRPRPRRSGAAIALYASVGEKPVHLRKELPGHVANRLQAALYREVVHLIDQGVLDVGDADDAVSWGPRRAVGRDGTESALALGGGAGGIRHFMDTLVAR